MSVFSNAKGRSGSRPYVRYRSVDYWKLAERYISLQERLTT